MRTIEEVYKDMQEKCAAYEAVKREMVEVLSKDIGSVILIDINKAKEEWVENQMHIIQK